MKTGITILWASATLALAFANVPVAAGQEKAVTKTVVAVENEQIPGSVRPRAAANWPDSAVIFTAAGEKSSKRVYAYDANGTQTYQDFDRENDRWVPATSDLSVPLPRLSYGSIRWEDSDIYWPHPINGMGGIGFGFTGNGGEIWDYKVIPTYDAKGNLTQLEFHVYEKANPDNSYLGYRYTFSYNGDGLPVLIEGYDGNELIQKTTYQWDSNGKITFYEHVVEDDNTKQLVVMEKYTSDNEMIVSETYYFWSGERKKTVGKTDSRGNPSILQFYTWTAGKWYMTHYTVYYPNDLVPAVETGDNDPVDDTNKGGFDIIINFPSDSVAGGSLVVKLPDGFTLDKDNTRLTADFGSFDLVVTQQEDGSWLLEIKPKAVRRAALQSGAPGVALAHVAYTVDSRVKRGVYDISAGGILFETPGGELIVEPGITIPVHVDRWGVGNEPVGATTRIRASGGRLYIDAATNGAAQVYTVAGQPVKTVALTAGQTTATPLPRGVYIVVAGGKTWKVIL